MAFDSYDLTTPPRPRNPDSWDARYIRSFLLLRTFVGLFAIALPPLLVLADRYLFEEGPFPRESLSGYYYSGTRELLVAMLSATGVFLVAYKVSPRSWENHLSSTAGVAALVIAIFPTAREDKTIQLTPLQKLLGERAVWYVHLGASIVFLVALAVISFLFGWRERGRARREGQAIGPHAWGWFHFGCAAAMALGLLWIFATSLADWPEDSVLAGEWLAAWAFGFSWLVKGLEIDMLRKDPRPPLPSFRRDDGGGSARP